MKTVEELLRPRYKVIADYPGSDFNIGCIIEFDCQTYFFGTLDWQSALVILPNGSSGIYGIGMFEPHPHLFRQLQWWEDREESDMPEYVRLREGKIVKIKNHFIEQDSKYKRCWFSYFGPTYNYIELYAKASPATEQEYNQQQNQ